MLTNLWRVEFEPTHEITCGLTHEVSHVGFETIGYPKKVAISIFEENANRFNIGGRRYDERNEKTTKQEQAKRAREQKLGIQK